MGTDQPIQVGRGRPGYLDPRHPLEVVQAYRPTSFGVLESLLGLLKRSGQAVQEGSRVARVGVSFVEGL